MATYWVGLENERTAPCGHGEDYREYVTVDGGDDGALKLQLAVLRLAKTLTNLEDGDRIAVHKV